MTDETGPTRDEDPLATPSPDERLHAVEEARHEIAEDDELRHALADASTEAPPWPGAARPEESRHEEPDPDTTRSD